jgi:hypothetical protein
MLELIAYAKIPLPTDATVFTLVGSRVLTTKAKALSRSLQQA